MNRRAADAALAFNTLVWGATFTLVKSALRDVSPVLFLALRFSLAAGALGALWFVTGRRPKTEGRTIRGGILAGILLFGGFLLQTLGLQFTTPPKSAFLTGLASVMVPLLGALVYRVKPQALEVLGVLVATTGLGLMTLDGPVGSLGKGDLLTLLCAVAFAGHIVTLGHYSARTSFEMLALAQIATAAGLALGLFWWVEPLHIVWNPAVIYAILVTGLLATALAFTIQAWAQKFTSSTRTALIYTLEPVFAWLISYGALGEGLAGRAAAGAALILGGVVLVELKPFGSRLHP
ncbi:MAG TPA: DMT family transporter [Bryobacteraceae bacterium]|nr:DMT family transporter [Bryobacteraceae bacterium]